MTSAQDKRDFESALQSAEIAAKPFFLKRLDLAVQLVGLVFILVGTALIARLIVQWLYEGVTARWTEDITVLVSLVVLTFGFFQWRAGRQEASLDKFYDRLDMSNKKMDAWKTQWYKEAADALTETKGERPETKELSELEIHLHDMYVFSELDNLEYVLQKYHLGYVTPELAGRALHTFESRCRHSPRFHRRATALLGSGAAHVTASAYQTSTQQLVTKVCKDCGEPATTLQALQPS